MIVFFNFVIALWEMFQTLKKQRGEQELSAFIDSVNAATKKAKEAKTHEDRLDAAADLVDILKRLG